MSAATATDLVLPISLLKNELDNRPSLIEMPWPDMVLRFEQPDIRMTKEGGQGWTPATYPKDQHSSVYPPTIADGRPHPKAGKLHPWPWRNNQNVGQLVAAVLDLEHFSDFIDLAQRLRPYEHVIHSTFSHTPENPRWRVILPMSYWPTADQWFDYWARINAALAGGKNDQQTKDPARLYYWPAHPEGVEPFYRYNQGQLLDPRELPIAPEAETTDASHSANGTARQGAVHHLGYATLDFVANGAPIGWQRRRALGAARAYWEAGYSVEETAAAVSRGLKASPVGDAAKPWTEADALAFARDIARRKPPPLAPQVVTELLPSANAVPLRGAATVARIPEIDRPEPAGLDEVISAFQRWMYLPDDGVVLATLGAVAANLSPGDPLWLMIVGASSGGKTEVLNSISGLPYIHAAATLTESSLLSGTPKREKDKGAKGGLLREIGAFGLLVCKDFTSVLSMNRDPRAALLAALREIYDGAWTRHVGVDGGRTLAWQGKIGLLAGCTTSIDSHHAVTATMGERFLYYRLPEIDTDAQGRRALGNTGREHEMRTELAGVTRRLLANLDCSAGPPDLTDDETERLVSLASVAARARSAVERDGRTREIELIPDPEAPARIAGALRRLYGGLLLIGLDQQRAWSLVGKIAFDCMPKLRRSIFELLAATTAYTATKDVALRVGYPTQTARRSLEDLMVHGVVIRKPAGKLDTWLLSDWARIRRQRADVPEMSVSPCTDTDPDSPSSNSHCVGGDFSGTSAEQGGFSFGDDPADGESGTRVSSCWSCKQPIETGMNSQCEACGWLICGCGACGEGCSGGAA